MTDVFLKKKKKIYVFFSIMYPDYKFGHDSMLER